jgi:ribosomal protein S18 acetylase RimI-like enzyme
MITLRRETEFDRDFLRDLYASTRAEEMDLLDWTQRQKHDFLAMQFRAQTTHYADYYPDAERSIIECDGAPIGRLYVDRRAGEIEIIDIALLPAMRGRGIGKALLRQVIAESRTTARRLRIYVEHFNPARGLYDRLGFRQVGTNGVYHELELAAR